jgi:hypothetical protein
VPHSTVSTRTKEGKKACPYCGKGIPSNHVACREHSDLPALEPLDDRFTLTEDKHRD